MRIIVVYDGSSTESIEPLKRSLKEKFDKPFLFQSPEEFLATNLVDFDDSFDIAFVQSTLDQNAVRTILQNKARRIIESTSILEGSVQKFLSTL